MKSIVVGTPVFDRRQRSLALFGKNLGTLRDDTRVDTAVAFGRLACHLPLYQGSNSTQVWGYNFDEKSV